MFVTRSIAFKIGNVGGYRVWRRVGASIHQKGQRWGHRSAGVTVAGKDDTAVNAEDNGRCRHWGDYCCQRREHQRDDACENRGARRRSDRGEPARPFRGCRGIGTPTMTSLKSSQMKSVARMPRAWARRNCRQLARRGAGRDRCRLAEESTTPYCRRSGSQARRGEFAVDASSPPAGHLGGADETSSSGLIGQCNSATVDPPVTPGGVLPGQPQH